MRAAALLAMAALAGGAAAQADGATRAVTVSGWHNQVAAFSGRHLLIGEAATVRVSPAATPGAPAGARPFNYYRAELRRVALTGDRLRFDGTPATASVVRTSIGAMRPGVVAPAGAGNYVVAPQSSSFATPVIWCCTEGVEVVTESDSRAEAPRVLAAHGTTARVRQLLRHPDGRMSLVAVTPRGLGERRTEAEVAIASRPGLAALQAGRAVWVDPADPRVLRHAPVSDTGLGAAATVRLPGAAVGLWSGGTTVAVAVRVGNRVRVVRWEAPGGRAQALWNGRAIPRVAVGGGTVALADGRRILAARTGRPPVAVARSTGPVAAVAADGTRVAWLARVRQKGSRVTMARLAATR